MTGPYRTPARVASEPESIAVACAPRVPRDPITRALDAFACELMRIGRLPLEVTLPVRMFEEFLREVSVRVPSARTFALADGWVTLATAAGPLRVRVEHAPRGCPRCGERVPT